MKKLITTIAILLNLTGFAQDTSYNVNFNTITFDNKGVEAFVKAGIVNERWSHNDISTGSFSSTKTGEESVITIMDETLHAYDSYILGDGTLVFLINQSSFVNEDGSVDVIDYIDKMEVHLIPTGMYGEHILIKGGGTETRYFVR